MLDEGEEERKENLKAQQEAAEALKKKQIEMQKKMLSAQPAHDQRLSSMNRVKHHKNGHHSQMRRHQPMHHNSQMRRH